MRSSLLALLAIGSGLAVAASHLLIWIYAPVEQTMGPIQKIFYVHLPLAWLAMLSFFVVFIASIVHLVKKDPKSDHVAGAAAELGVLCSALALITGSMWARYSWNTWWTWDPRLTTTLIMWFIYAGYLVVRSLDMNKRQKARICAVVGIVAFLDVPLVFLSARMWRSIHPAVFASKQGGLPAEMMTTVLVCFLAMSLFWLCLCVLRTRQLELAARLDDFTLSAQRSVS